MIKKDLTQSETWLLNIVYELGETDIDKILQFIAHEKDWKYTTVQTLIHRLCDKGYIERNKVNRRYIYKPIHSREHVLERILNRLFGNSLKKDPGPLVSYLIRAKKLNDKEQKLLQSILDVERKGKAKAKARTKSKAKAKAKAKNSDTSE